MKLTFNITYHTNWGESVFIVGSHPKLGDGNEDKALKMDLEHRQKRLLDYLQVAEIAARQVVGDEGYLCRERLYFVALGAGEFKHIGVFLVWHYR